MTVQYFFMRAKSFSISRLPTGSTHFLAYLVNAFFFDLYLDLDFYNKWVDSLIRGQPLVSGDWFKTINAFLGS